MLSIHTELKDQIRTCVALAVVVCIGVVGANAATASFTDVPNEGQFSESITRVQESGIATGYNDGSFRPTNALNRQQGAAWIDRSVARVGLGFDPSQGHTIWADSPSVTIAEVEMTSPATDNGQGWLTLQGGVGGVTEAQGAACPCVAHVLIRDEDDQLVGRSVLTVLPDNTGEAVVIAPVFSVTPIAGGETHTYRLIVELVDPSQQLSVAGVLYAMYAPMAEGDPPTFPEPESGGSDPVESLVP